MSAPDCATLHPGYARQSGVTARGEFFLRRRQIQPVESRIIKEIAFQSKCFVIHLAPLNRRFNSHVHRRKIQRLGARRCAASRRRTTCA